MDLNTILLVTAALLPALLLCNYIYKKDRVEKEPTFLLVKLLAAGAFACFPAAVVEGILEEVINNLFDNIRGIGLSLPKLYTLYRLVTYFIGVALVEEWFKRFFLIKITKNDNNFNSLFDGMIYAIFVSLGFAALENVMYVTEYGWVNALMRAVLSVPGHMFFAVMMGYYYSRWKIFEDAAKMEEELIRGGYIAKTKRPFNCRVDKYLSLIVPIMLHGIYNYCCSSQSLTTTAVFYGFVIFMYIYCFRKIKETSIEDAPTTEKIKALVIKKYPEIEYLFEENTYA